jgi:GWxTD domain-containing protein
MVPMVSRFSSGLAAFVLLPFLSTPDGFLEDEVHYLISSRERAELLALEGARDRERFIERFWVLRDPTPRTLRNEARESHQRRLEESDALFREGALRGRHSERGRIHQLLGPPRFRESFDRSPLVPLELWHYTAVESGFLPESFYLVFYRPPGDTRYRLFRPAIDGVSALFQENEPGRGLLQAELPHVPGIDLELRTAIESPVPGGEAESVKLLAALDALPDLLDRDRRETASVRSEASFGRIEAGLAAALLYDDARVAEIHYALELDPDAARALLARSWNRFTLQGALLGPSGELDRWEDTLAVEISTERLEPGILSFQGRRLAPPLAERVEIALVSDRGGSAFASAEVSPLLLARGVRTLDDPGDLPFRVGDRLFNPIADDAIVDPRVIGWAQAPEVDGDVVWELFDGENRLWHDRGATMKELPLSILAAGSYRLVAQAGSGRFEKTFAWRPGKVETPRVRVLSRERTPREEAHYRRARASAFSNRGDPARATTELARAAAAVPEDLRLQLELASFRYASGKHREVVEQMSAARTAFPEQIDVLVLLGASLEALGRVDEAVAIYEDGVALSPQNSKLRESYERARGKLSPRSPRRDR